jgi:hypothetical protein
MGCFEEKEYEFIYEVTGTAKIVSVTYFNANGDIEQIAKTVLSWKKTLNVSAGYIYSLYAQNQGKTGSRELIVYRNGEKIKSAKSSGQFCVATLSGQ